MPVLTTTCGQSLGSPQPPIQSTGMGDSFSRLAYFHLVPRLKYVDNCHLRMHEVLFQRRNTSPSEICLYYTYFEEQCFKEIVCKFLI